MHEPPATRRSLIVQLRDPADTIAWGEFVVIYGPSIYRLARRQGPQDADAHDLCREIFRAVAGAVGQWGPDRGTFRARLARIARNLLITMLTRGPSRLRSSGATSVRAFPATASRFTRLSRRPPSIGLIIRSDAPAIDKHRG